MRKFLLQFMIVFLALCHSVAFGQNTMVSGKVTGPDNLPLSGASVTVSKTKKGAITDAEGKFSLAVPPNGSLVFNSIGFLPQTVEVSGRSSINVQLLAGEANFLDEVVITGYSAQRKKDIVGSVAVVDVKALKSVPSSSAMQALQGQAAGVDVTNNGSPGAPSLIFIRGITGFSNTPLVLIDGVQGDINQVPADDVESIQVLKDAGAASIYGARGSNGVIVITTRKGKSGGPMLTYDSYYNFQIPNKGSSLNTINAQQYADIMSEINPSSKLFVNGGLPDYVFRGPSTRGIGNEGDASVNPSLYVFNPKNRSQNYIISKLNKNAQGGDVYDQIFNPALMMNHNISASGGTDRATYLVSFGYLNHQGTLKNTYLKRYNTRINTTLKVSNRVRIGENLNVYYTENPQAPSNGAFGPIQSAFSQLPFIPTYDLGGNYAGPFAGPEGELSDWGNAVAETKLTNNNRSRNFGIIGNAFLEIDLLKNLTARTSFGGAVTNYYNQTYKYTDYWKASGGSNNTLSERSGYATTAQWTNTLAYKNTFGKHNLNVLVGVESIENSNRQLSASGEKFLTDNYNYLILDNAEIQKRPNSSAGEDALYSLFGRLDYSYNDKYLLGFTIRRDGFSAFGPDKKYGVFPAIALGWRVSQESFMRNVSWINDMKIRGSYGIMGNKEGINPTNSYSTYSQGPRNSYYDINGVGNAIVQGFYPQQNGNSFTSWERNKLFNIGFDATILNNHLDLSLDYYKKSTDGLLRPVQVPYTAGEARSPFVNIGDVQNKGIDITATYRAKVNKDLQLSVGVNFTSYKNKIIKLEDPGFFDEGILRFEQGESG